MPSRYRKFGKTAKGDPRFQCKACKKTFSLGKSSRRHFRSDLNGKVLRSIVNGMTISAICRTLDVQPAEVYRKIDFIHVQCQAFAAERERLLPSAIAGQSPYFATDTQILQVNWPDRGVRKAVEVRHICTVARDSNYVVASTTDVDPDVQPAAIEKVMEIVGDLEKPRSMRENARVWFATEYLKNLRDKHDALNKSRGGTEKGAFTASEEDVKLLEKAARVRQDAAEFAHIMLVKKKLGSKYAKLNFSTDRDAGLSAAYAAVFANEVKAKRVRIADIAITKYLVTDQRKALVAEGNKEYSRLQRALDRSNVVLGTGDPVSPRKQDGVMEVLVRSLLQQRPPEDYLHELMNYFGERESRDEGLLYPFHFINEPEKRVIFKTNPNDLNYTQIAQFAVRSGTHPVDMYHARARTKIMGFERGLVSSGRGRLWYYKQYYNPVMVSKMVDILRFAHNYTNLMNKAKDTPAMKIGLAKGFVYERDLFAF